jgi:lysozyme family protein
MSATNRRASFLATMKWEGGETLSLDRADPGNWTGGRVGAGALRGSRWGVSASAHPTLDIANLTIDDALKIFVDGYWNAIGADAMADGVDHCVSDDAYNSGPGAALRRYRRRVVVGDALATIRAHSLARLSFLRSLRVWRSFGRGWAARVAGVEAESVVMATKTASADPSVSRAHVDAQARGAGAQAARSRGRAALLALIALLSPFVHLTLTGRVVSISLALVTVMFAIAVGLSFWSMIVHQERSRALAKAAGTI